MSILVATIPHTGTRFLNKLFKGNGLIWRPLGERPADVYFTHLYSGFLPKVLAFDGQIVCPMRKREKIEASWRARNEQGTWFPNTLDECFAVFDKIKDKALIIHIDDEAMRDRELASVSDIVGVKLKTDWAVVGARK